MQSLYSAAMIYVAMMNKFALSVGIKLDEEFKKVGWLASPLKKLCVK